MAEADMLENGGVARVATIRHRAARRKPRAGARYHARPPKPPPFR
jgi:hypothetical protein